jgi:hypothetical protein
MEGLSFSSIEKKKLAKEFMAATLALEFPATIANADNKARAMNSFAKTNAIDGSCFKAAPAIVQNCKRFHIKN